MTEIRKLPQSEIDKICAGEVVERPASIVKELIENAIDGHSTRIEISIEDGGKRLISVSDNGAGIPTNEVDLALSPHCTSKIRRADDLYEKHTLGFRGEALYSIAAVSRLTLTSRSREEAVGCEVLTAEGSVLCKRMIAFNYGTKVDVRELFFNTPVRRKFLKAKSTEVNHILSLLYDYAICYPEIEWSMLSEGKSVFKTEGDGNIVPVVKQVYNGVEEKDIVFIDHIHAPVGIRDYDIESVADSLRLSGIAIRPHQHRTNRAGQHFFVNRRPVRNRIFFKAVDDAFREYVSPGKHPMCALIINISPAEIDVNIHPSKYEVNFSDSQKIYALIAIGVKRALSDAASKNQRDTARSVLIEQPLADFAGQTDTGAERIRPMYQQSISKKRDDAIMQADNARNITRSVPLYTQRDSSTTQLNADTIQPIKSALSSGDFSSSLSITKEESYSSSKPLSSIVQIGNTFISFIQSDTLYLVDQHSAHERILFEEIYSKMTTSDKASARQGLVFPILMPIKAVQIPLVKKYLPALIALGFDVEVFGEDTLLLREVPAIVSSRIDSSVFQAMMLEIIEGEKEKTFAEMIKHVAATTACKCAVKAGEALSIAEMEWIVKALTNIRDSFTCPHGRPTMLKFSVRDIGKLFQRS